MQEQQRIEEKQQQNQCQLSFNKPTQQSFDERVDQVDQPGSHERFLVQQEEVYQRDDYSDQPNYNDSSEEDSNQTISERNRPIEIYHKEWDWNNQEIEQREQRVSSHSAQWSSEQDKEGYAEQIFQMAEQKIEFEGQHQSIYTSDNIKEDQGLFVSPMSEYNEQKQRLNQPNRQQTKSLCNGCGLLKSNLTRKVVDGLALNIYFCAQCDSKYDIISK